MNTDQPQLPLDNARKQVFVAYSYRLYPKDDYRKLYKELEAQHEVTFIFADEKITNMHIMKKIESYIRNSDFSIFDISGWNPNVTLELGFAMASNEQWYIALNPDKTEIKEVPSDLRGLDRIEYSSYTDLQTKLKILIGQRYPRRKTSGIDDFLSERRSHILDLLRRSPGLSVANMAQVLGLDVPVVQLVIQPLIGTDLEYRGKTRGRKYYIVGTAPADRSQS
ncbi:hypothetical protein DB347_09585 [Opitutaceae bacterium EW11]|nr:hypothetical protein DB347_09585 [Opitutaceae bacterium EW11]